MYDVHELVLRNDGARTTRNVGSILLHTIRATIGIQLRWDEFSARAAVLKDLFRECNLTNRRKLTALLDGDIDRLRRCARELLGEVQSRGQPTTIRVMGFNRRRGQSNTPRRRAAGGDE